SALVDELPDRDYGVAGGHHHENPGPPGTESGEEAPERAQRLLRPHVERALLGEHLPQLRRDERTRDQEGEERDYPVRESGLSGGLNTCRVHDEEDDRDEDDRHVERAE